MTGYLNIALSVCSHAPRDQPVLSPLATDTGHQLLSSFATIAQKTAIIECTSGVLCELPRLASDGAAEGVTTAELDQRTSPREHLDQRENSTPRTSKPGTSISVRRRWCRYRDQFTYKTLFTYQLRRRYSSCWCMAEGQLSTIVDVIQMEMVFPRIRDDFLRGRKVALQPDTVGI